MSSKNKSGAEKDNKAEAKSEANEDVKASEADDVAVVDADEAARKKVLKQFSDQLQLDDAQAVIGEAVSAAAPVQSVSVGSKLSPLQVQGAELKRLHRRGGVTYVSPSSGRLTHPAFPSPVGHQSVIGLEEATGPDGAVVGWKDDYGRVFQTPGVYLQVSRELYDDPDLGVGIMIEGLHETQLLKWIQKPNNEGKLVGGQKTVVLIGCTSPGCIQGSEHMETLRRGRVLILDENGEPQMRDIQVQLSEFENARSAKVPQFGWQDLPGDVQFGNVLCHDFGDLVEARKAAAKDADYDLVRAINEAMDSQDRGAPMAFLRATSDLQNPCHPLNTSAANPSGEDHATLRYVVLGELDGREVVKPIKQSLGAWAACEAEGIINLSGQEFELQYGGLDPKNGRGIPRRPGVCPTCKSWAEGQTRGRKASKGKRAKAATSLVNYRQMLAKKMNSND